MVGPKESSLLIISPSGGKYSNYGIFELFVRLEEERLKKLIMNREITELTAIIFANLLDVIPLISNTNDRTESSLLHIYYRNAAYFQNMNQELLIEHPEEINIME